MGNYKDMLGKTFERLTVIDISNIRAKNGQVMWKCMCDCGSITYVRGDSLRSGAVKSCGCWGRERRIEAVFNDISGQKFGRLLAIESTDKRSGESVVWKCLCDCGNIVNVSGGSLRTEHTASCGCYHKDKVKNMLTTHGLSYTKEYGAMEQQKRRELEILYDSEVTLELELALKEFFPVCVLCGSKENLSKEHVLPLSKGHGLKPGNAVVTCRSCNSRKKDKHITELPLEDQVNLIWNAFRFKDYWETLDNKKCASI